MKKGVKMVDMSNHDVSGVVGWCLGAYSKVENTYSPRFVKRLGVFVRFDEMKHSFECVFREAEERSAMLSLKINWPC